ncbi:MAG: hypothetical protein HYZ57_10190, partial [Acidobacteria bacterium]|nr:hypothetical protein [Acidobacteriota bacterium]
VNARDPLGVLVRDKIVPILEKYHVPVAFAGHEHSFQRTHPLLAGEMTDAANGIVYLTTGGGGARLYPFYPAPHIAAGASVHHYLRCDVNGAKMIIRAINADGEEIDRAVIAPPPLLSPASVVNSASFEPAVARGGLVSIFGMQLAPEDIVTSRKPLPRQVNGFRVLVNDEPLPLLMISPTQVNAVLPMNVAGSATLKVVTGNGSVETAIRIREVAPALFSTALFRADGRQIAEDAPAAAGEIVSVYGTGLGAVDGETAIDQPAAAAHPVVAPVRLLLDGAFMDPLSATLAEGLVGVYKITFGVPAVPAGTHSLRLEAGGETSNPVFLPITG